MESKHICPWWRGYLLTSPLRRLRQNPHRILSPYVRIGMTVLEPGPGMGFFTLELARLIGASGKVIAIDVQPRMLKTLARRARRAGLQDRIVLRQSESNRMGVEEFRAQVDFVLAFAVVHEVPDAAGFFSEMFSALKPEGRMLLSEPSKRVNVKEWQETLRQALVAGFVEERPLDVWRMHSTLLMKPNI
jgi:ubiquinone/menaquinone biosynthesis C-methylase UbiE